MSRPQPAAAPIRVEADIARAAILGVIARIPSGHVASYGQVAWAAGLPGRARLVGRILASNLEAEQTPWHRVINAKGEIALPKFSPIHREQKARLRAEGVVFERGGRISLRRYGWQTGDSSPLLD
jgi:methylated-DNA-protein-cysteine methyltransferase related protein